MKFPPNPLAAGDFVVEGALYVPGDPTKTQGYFGQRGSFIEINGAVYLMSNAWNDGTTWRYLRAGVAYAMAISPFGIPAAVYYAASGAEDAVISWIEMTPGRALALAQQTTTATTGVQTTETVLTGLSSIALSATGINKYLLALNVQAQHSAASGIITFRVRDGGASAPTNASTQIAEWNVQGSATAATNLDYGEEFVTSTALSAGTHTLGVFMVRGSGTGTNSVSTAVSATHPTTFFAQAVA